MPDTTARIKLIEGIQLLGESGSGHPVVMDAAEELGGRNIGIRPMEMLLLGMGGCTAIDVLNILRKGRKDVQDCEVSLRGTRAETEPKVYTKIQVHYKITGSGISEKALLRAIELSEEKYCSASLMLGKTAEITSSYEIVEA